MTLRHSEKSLCFFWSMSIKTNICILFFFGAACVQKIRQKKLNEGRYLAMHHPFRLCMRNTRSVAVGLYFTRRILPMSGTSVSQRPSRCCALRIRSWRTSATGAVLGHCIISAASSDRARASHRRSSVRSGARQGAETGERKGKDTETGRMAGNSEKRGEKKI